MFAVRWVKERQEMCTLTHSSLLKIECGHGGDLTTCSYICMCLCKVNLGGGESRYSKCGAKLQLNGEQASWVDSF